MRALENREFTEKPKLLQHHILAALEILRAFGIPLDGLTDRRLERMAIVFMAVADVRPGAFWSTAKDVLSGRSLKTREIITLLNSSYSENISSGSYDDIRRRDLQLLVQSGVVVQTAPRAARNAPNRGYALDDRFAQLLREYGNPEWSTAVSAHLASVGSLADRLKATRNLEMIPVTLPGGRFLQLTPGEHNQLQRVIVEQFLPRFGRGAELLYLGDAANKRLHLENARLQELQFFEINHGELPDVIAYSPQENWLYLIEAVHSFGPISPSRKLTLENAAKGCTADLVFVTAFPDRATFRKFIADLAWEQEVWLADEPDHLVHFNGHKFMGPHL